LTFNPGSEQRSNLWAACNAADRLKNTGAKIFLVGVGDVTNNQDEIQVVTGLTPWDGNSTTFFRSDYIISANYSALAGLFTSVGAGLCPCLASYPACADVSGSCDARLFSAIVQVTTTDTSVSTVFPKNSVIAAYIYYQMLGGANARVGYDFFDVSQSWSSATPNNGQRVDILNPCKLQRLVSCGSGCYNIQEQQALPRFFLESVDVLGTPQSRLYSNRTFSNCVGYTKVYNYPTFPFQYGLGAPEVIKYVWIMPDGKTPCAAEAFDGTFYEFFNSTSSRGVVRIGSAPTVLPAATQAFSFVPASQCTVPNCTNPVEMIFVIDEQSALSSVDFANVKTFIVSLINGAANPASQFGWIWSNSGFEAILTGLTPQVLPGNDLATFFSRHVRAYGTSDFASLVTQVFLFRLFLSSQNFLIVFRL
jgi:hypothetical protein